MFRTKQLIFVGLALTICQTAHAQKWPLFSFNCVNKIELTVRNADVELSLNYVRNGGTRVQREFSQMYLVLYFDRDESRVKEIVNDKQYRQKSSEPEQQLLAQLEKESLGIVLTSKSSKSGRYGRDGEVAGPIVGAVDKYDFVIKFDTLLKSAQKLRPSIDEGEGKMLKEHLRLFVFVPVNDSNYANKIPPEGKGESFGTDESVYDSKTLVQYLSHLPYRFTITRTHDGTPLVLVD